MMNVKSRLFHVLLAALSSLSLSSCVLNTHIMNVAAETSEEIGVDFVVEYGQKVDCITDQLYAWSGEWNGMDTFRRNQLLQSFKARHPEARVTFEVSEGGVYLTGEYTTLDLVSTVCTTSSACTAYDESGVCTHTSYNESCEDITAREKVLVDHRATVRNLERTQVAPRDGSLAVIIQTGKVDTMKNYYMTYSQSTFDQINGLSDPAFAAYLNDKTYQRIYPMLTAPIVMDQCPDKLSLEELLSN